MTYRDHAAIQSLLVQFPFENEQRAIGYLVTFLDQAHRGTVLTVGAAFKVFRVLSLRQTILMLDHLVEYDVLRRDMFLRNIDGAMWGRYATILDIPSELPHPVTGEMRSTLVDQVSLEYRFAMAKLDQMPTNVLTSFHGAIA